MLVILAGLPGAGKTTIARELARQLRAVHVRIDSIEQAIRQSGIARSMEDGGYRVAYAVAADNLRLGHTVVADSVNPIAASRRAWREVAARAGVAAVDVEITCADRDEHRRRVETRRADIDGHTLPAWQDVVDRGYEVWEEERMVIDTAGRTIDECVAMLRTALASRRPG